MRVAGERRSLHCSLTLKLLAGFANADLCEAETREMHYDAALRACDAALAVGEETRLLLSKAMLLRHPKQYEARYRCSIAPCTWIRTTAAL